MLVSNTTFTYTLFNHFHSPSIPDELHRPLPLTSVQEARFLRRFSEEVGPWFDLSDSSFTFSKKICQLATRDPLLKAAAIACAAKQLYLTRREEVNEIIARDNYNTLLSLLIPRLEKSNHPHFSAVFAATVMCCAYEMMDANESEWQKHLEGVFTFGQMGGINGACGGIEQAGFWAIARQEVVRSIVKKTILRSDPNTWTIDLENIGKEGDKDLVFNQ